MPTMALKYCALIEIHFIVSRIAMIILAVFLNLEESYRDFALATVQIRCMLSIYVENKCVESRKQIENSGKQPQF